MPGSTYIPVVQPLPTVDSPLRGLPNSRSRRDDTLLERLKTARFGVALVVAVGISSAASDSFGVTVRGSQSCGVWLSVQQKNARLQSETWLIGFLSGIAVALDSNFLKGTDNESIFLWMDNFCRKNPLEQIGNGASELAVELIEKKRP
jgi:hypothetical protein